MNESANNLINRKEALKRVSYLLGGVVSAPTVLGFLNGCTASNAPIKNFTPDQIQFLSQVSDIIIPATDTPSASEVGVPKFMDDMIFTIWDEEGRTYFLDSMSDFQEKATRDLGKPFIEASEQERTDFINKEHDSVFGGEVNWDAPRPFIWMMKEQTIAGYFSSEEGMTQVLQYAMVPGRWDGCLTFEEAGGKVWAT
ncbi:MAG: gluconate 2-dehydrogenase subunit 3 family protein [Balneolaceae bacterium]